MRIPLHTLHPPTDYIGTLTDAATQRLGVGQGRRVYCPVPIYFAAVYDGAERIGVVDIGDDGIRPDNPPTRLESVG